MSIRSFHQLLFRLKQAHTADPNRRRILKAGCLKEYMGIDWFDSSQFNPTAPSTQIVEENPTMSLHYIQQKQHEVELPPGMFTVFDGQCEMICPVRHVAELQRTVAGRSVRFRSSMHQYIEMPTTHERHYVNLGEIVTLDEKTKLRPLVEDTVLFHIE